MFEDRSGRFGVFNFASRRAARETTDENSFTWIPMRNTRCNTPFFVAAYRAHLSAIQPWIAVLSTYATISLISSKIRVVSP